MKSAGAVVAMIVGLTAGPVLAQQANTTTGGVQASSGPTFPDRYTNLGDAPDMIVPQRRSQRLVQGPPDSAADPGGLPSQARELAEQTDGQHVQQQ